MVRLQQLIKALPACQVAGDDNPVIQSLVMDNREAEKGSLFFCIKGFTVDGHDFAEKAVKAGSVAVVAERDLPHLGVPVVKVRDSYKTMAILAAHFYQFPASEMQMIGVTGTNGKTTVTHLIRQILSDYNIETGIIGTMYMKFKGTEINVKNTTPDALTLQKSFSEMIKHDVKAVAMEVSSHALELGRVHGADFNIGVFTNLSKDHLDYHETMANYGRAKGLLFSQLGNSYNCRNQNVAVLNSDDPYFPELKKITAVPVLTYGLKQEADVRAEDVSMHETGCDFVLCAGDERLSVHLKMPGRFSVYNALAAAAAAFASGVPLSSVQQSLARVSGVAGRFEKVESDAPVHVIVDYAHTPDSLENVLQTVREIAGGKVAVVVGCGGDRDKTKRPDMAAIAERLADKVYLTSDNPRSEDPESILEDMVKGMKQSNYKVITSRKEAIFEAVKQAEMNEVILIAGKGHETYQIIGNETYDFDDRLVAAEALKERF